MLEIHLDLSFLETRKLNIGDSTNLDSVKCDKAKSSWTPLVINDEIHLLDSSIAREVTFQVPAAGGVTEIQEKIWMPKSRVEIPTFPNGRGKITPHLIIKQPDLPTREILVKRIPGSDIH